jgi:hypothetical protein
MKNIILIILGAITISSFQFDKGTGRITVVYREDSGAAYPEGGHVPDKVWKEIYGANGGKIELIKTVQGKHIPMHIEREQIVFDDEGQDKTRWFGLKKPRYDFSIEAGDNK